MIICTCVAGGLGIVGVIVGIYLMLKLTALTYKGAFEAAVDMYRNRKNK